MEGLDELNFSFKLRFQLKTQEEVIEFRLGVRGFA